MVTISQTTKDFLNYFVLNVTVAKCFQGSLNFYMVDWGDGKDSFRHPLQVPSTLPSV
jgi:hypothetical protein